MELVSVIVPVYNAAAYLDEALESLTYQVYDHLEIILVDDGSTDDSVSICKKYAEMDSRFRYYPCPHKGVAAARNFGISVANGVYVGFLDSDDWIEPDFYHELVSLIQKSDTPIAMCGYYDYSQKMRRFPEKEQDGSYMICGKTDALFHVLERTGYFTSVWNKLYRKDFLMQNSISFDERLAVGEDEVWLIEQLLSCEKIAFTAKILYHWKDGSGVSRNKKLTKDSLTVVLAKQKVCQILREKLPASSCKQQIVQLANSRLLNDCFALKVLAYKEHNKKLVDKFTRLFRVVAWDFITSKDVTMMRKMKVVLEEIMMQLHVCGQVIGWIDGFRRRKTTG